MEYDSRLAVKVLNSYVAGVGSIPDIIKIKILLIRIASLFKCI